MADCQSYSYDVLVIGAGGAGLRAAIEAAASGVKVGVVCKSLLGKAHTVMAEGGVAAALANVDDRDNWRVHFADTMRGGQYLNNWRMAEIARQRSSRTCQRARGVGRCVRSHERWPHSPTKLRRPSISQTRARRRSYRAGDDSHVAGPTDPYRNGSAHGMHGPHTAPRWRSHCRAFGYNRENGHFIL